MTLSAPTASPESASAKARDGLKYSELTPTMIGLLRIYRAVEQIYPQGTDRATRTLEGYDAWRAKRTRLIQPTAHGSAA